MSSKPGTGSVVSKVLCVLILTLLPAFVIGDVLASLGFVPAVLRSTGMLLAACCFLVGACAIAFSSVSRRKIMIWFSGIAVTLVVVAASAVLVLVQLAMLYPVEALATTLTVVSLLFVLRSRRDQRDVPSVTHANISPLGAVVTSAKLSLRSLDLVKGIEVVGIPDEYLGLSEEAPQSRANSQPFHNLLRVLMVAGVPLALRLERHSGKTRVYYLTWSHDAQKMAHYEQSLVDAVRAHLPHFDVRIVDALGPLPIDSQDIGIAVHLHGEPLSYEEEKQQVDSLTVMADVLQQLDNGIIQACAIPYEASGSELRATERDYQKQMEQSQRTVSTSSRALLAEQSQLSTTRVDVRASRLASQTLQDVKRLSSRYLCRAGVTAACWDQDDKRAERNVRRLMDVLMGTLAPAAKEKDFSVTLRKSKSEFERVCRGLPSSELTVLTPEEAAVFFVLPERDLGIRVSKRSSFSSGSASVIDTHPQENSIPLPAPAPLQPVIEAPRSRPVAQWKYDFGRTIFLGFPLNSAGEPIRDRPIGICVDMMDSHTFIGGGTRSGKSTAGISISAQSSRLAITPVVLAGSKGLEWAVLLAVDPDARVFTPGDPGIAPLCFNVFRPPPGVPVHRWLDRLVNVFCSWMPNDGVLKMHFEDVFYTAYRRCGWSVSDNTHGREMTLVDLYEAAIEVSRNLEYGEEVRKNILGAMLARIRAMLRNPATVRMYNTVSGLTVPELMGHTTVVAMDGLTETDKVLLTGLLTAAISEYRMANPLPRIGNLLVIEEAHYLLGRPRQAREGEPSIAQEAIANVITMLRTCGGAGLGLVFLDQLGTSLVDEATQIPVNFIIHALSDPREMQLAGLHARCTPEQIEHISGMKRGEAIVFLESEKVPVNVRIVPLSELVTTPLPKGFWKPEQVKMAMQPVYQKHPELGASVPLPDTIIQQLERRTTRTASPASEVPPQASATENGGQTRASEPGPETDALVRKWLKSTAFSELFSQRLGQAVQGDVHPFARLVSQYCSKFCPKGVDRRLFARRLLEISKEVFGAPEKGALTSEIESTVEQDSTA